MGEKARKIQNAYLLSLPPNKRMFPINAGMGWCGKVLRRTDDMIVIHKPRPLHAAPPGWPDLVGFEQIEITPDMVGQKIAVFCAEEIKAGKDTLTTDQKRFKKLFESMNCFYRIITG